MVETVLESALFEEALTHEERHSLLFTALYTAVVWRSDRWIALLLAHGADPNVALVKAVALGSDTALAMLVSHGAHVQGQVLFPPANDARDSMIRAMVLYGADTMSERVLHYAVTNCTADIVQQLIDVGMADIDHPGVSNRTPLMVLAYWPSRRLQYSDLKTTIAEILLRAGADLHAVDEGQRGVLHYAVRDKTVTWRRWLLERGVNPNHQDAKGQTSMPSFLRRNPDAEDAHT